MSQHSAHSISEDLPGRSNANLSTETMHLRRMWNACDRWHRSLPKARQSGVGATAGRDKADHRSQVAAIEVRALQPSATVRGMQTARPREAIHCARSPHSADRRRPRRPQQRAGAMRNLPRREELVRAAQGQGGVNLCSPRAGNRSPSQIFACGSFGGGGAYEAG